MRSDIMQQAQALRAAMLAAAAHVTGDDDRLRIKVLYPSWAQGKHAEGNIYTADGQVWECFQRYDSALHPDIVPGNAAWYTFNRPLHGSAPDTAMPFVQPTGAHDMYRTGEYMELNGDAYRCVSDTVYGPSEYAAAWELV